MGVDLEVEVEDEVEGGGAEVCQAVEEGARVVARVSCIGSSVNCRRKVQCDQAF